MDAVEKRRLTRKRKKAHIRKRLHGSDKRPRVSVFRSSNHIYAQAIDDESRITILSVGTPEKKLKEKIGGYTGNKIAAGIAGEFFGEKLVEAGIQNIIFDRNGYFYHGRIKSFADGIRKIGIQF